jgi:hypothetical protein
VTDVASVLATTLALPDASRILRLDRPQKSRVPAQLRARHARAAFNICEPSRTQKAIVPRLVSVSPIRPAEVAELLGKRSRVLGRRIDRKRGCRQTCH